MTSSSHWFRWLADARWADVVSTFLLLVVGNALIRGGAPVTLFGVSLPAPSFGPAVVLTGLWFGARALVRHRDALTPGATAQWPRRYLPEVIVGALFTVGLGMRLWGIGFGDPVVVHPDEHVVVGSTITMMKSGWIKPPVPYHYPTVFHYLLLPAFAFRYARGKSAGTWDSLSDVNIQSFEFYYLARAHSAVLGALTILLTYYLARTLWTGDRGRWVGVAAATFLTFSFNHVKESHFAVTDAALTFFVVLAAIAIVKAFQRGTTGAYAIAGFACGIACATKYSALPIVFMLIAAHVVGGPGVFSKWPRLVAGLAAVPVGFFTGYPYALLNWPPFLEHLGWISHAGADVELIDPVRRFNHMAGYSMESGFGQLATVTFAVAFVRALHRRRAEELLAIVFIVVSLALLARTAHPFYPRYLVPIVPFASVLIGGLLRDGAEWLAARRVSGTLLQAGFAALVVLLVWPQANESMQYMKYVVLPDTRAQAHRFILERFPPGSRIASDDRYLRLPRPYRLTRWLPLHSKGVADFEAAGIDAAVFSADREPAQQNRAGRQARDELRQRFPAIAAFEGREGVTAGPTITIHLVSGP